MLPHVSLGEFPTPVECAEGLAPGLWIKREDLAARPIGGNKVRGLEFLLGGVRPGDRIATAGAAGSTHALATAVFGRRLGAHVSVFRWPQEMSPNAATVAARVATAADYAPLSRSIAGAYLRAATLRLGARGTRWIPAGGSSPLGVLGQVDGALELAEQIAAGLLPAPRRIVVPLGSGGTAAGLVLGARLAGIETEIVAVRVAPWVVANRARVLRLARGAARLIERLTGARMPRPSRASVRVVHGFYGGAYGRPTAAGSAAAERCAGSLRITVDATYSAKALAASLAEQAGDGGPTLFWLTFDGRILKT
jgi:D-cysteine desulfhydrase